MLVVVVVVVVYGGRESDWGEDVRSWKNLWRREGEIFGMVEGGALEGGLGDGELGGFFRHVSRECDC